MCFGGGSGAPDYTKAPAEPLPDLKVSSVQRKPLTYADYKPKKTGQQARSLLMLDQ